MEDEMKVCEFTLGKFNVFCGQNVHKFNELVQALNERGDCFVLSGMFTSLDELVHKLEKHRVNRYLHENRNPEILQVIVIKHFMENISRHDFPNVLEYLQNKFPELTFVVWTQNEHAIQACAVYYKDNIRLFRLDIAEKDVTEYRSFKVICFAVENNIWLS